MAAIIRFLVVFTLSRSVPKASKQMHAVIAAMTNNPWFTSVAALVASALTNLLALDAAELAAATHAQGLVDLRDAKLLAVISDATALKAAVQRACDANPAEAAAIATSAAMAPRKKNKRVKRPLTATPPGVSGTLKLVALAIAGAGSYEWLMSQDEKTWTSLTATKKSKTTVTGLTVGAYYYFKVRGITSAGPTDWSQMVGATVL